MWLWKMLTEQHDVVYYEQLLRSEIENRIDTVEPWQESLIHDTAVMMVDRDEMMEEIRETGRLVTKWSKGGDPYQESNPLYVHLKEKERSIGMQREHLGLTAKSSKKMESPKTHDVKDDPIGEYFEGIR